jgi:hypothetical protein
MKVSIYYLPQNRFNATYFYISVDRVNWLRAKARHKRWEEEILIVKHEMVWTKLWFGYQKRQWEERMKIASLALSDGHKAYAAKQVEVWAQFLQKAQKAFVDVENSLQ